MKNKADLAVLIILMLAALYAFDYANSRFQLPQNSFTGAVVSGISVGDSICFKQDLAVSECYYSDLYPNDCDYRRTCYTYDAEDTCYKYNWRTCGQKTLGINYVDKTNGGCYHKDTENNCYRNQYSGLCYGDGNEYNLCFTGHANCYTPYKCAAKSTTTDPPKGGTTQPPAETNLCKTVISVTGTKFIKCTTGNPKGWYNDIEICISECKSEEKITRKPPTPGTEVCRWLVPVEGLNYRYTKCEIEGKCYDGMEGEKGCIANCKDITTSGGAKTKTEETTTPTKGSDDTAKKKDNDDVTLAYKDGRITRNEYATAYSEIAKGKGISEAIKSIMGSKQTSTNNWLEFSNEIYDKFYLKGKSVDAYNKYSEAHYALAGDKCIRKDNSIRGCVSKEILSALSFMYS